MWKFYCFHKPKSSLIVDYLSSNILSLSSINLISLSISFTSNDNNLDKEPILFPRFISKSYRDFTQPFDLYQSSSFLDNSIFVCPEKIKNEKTIDPPVIIPWIYDFINNS